MSFNLWHGGDAGKQPLDQTVAVIKESQADIVGLQETAGLASQGKPRPDRAAEIAKRLGWHYLDQGSNTGIISRFKIGTATPAKWGAKLELPSGRQLYLFNAHLAHSPYQPYQLQRIPYGNAPFLKTEAEAVQSAKDARGGQVSRMLAEVKAILPDGLPVFLTGDFNEPSHLDWTAAAVKANSCPVAVQWPSTRAVEAGGFIDAYRAVHSDPVKNRGLTWTPTTKADDPKDRHDRIDFVFVNGSSVKIRAARIVGEAKEFADVVVTPYPSDHRAVVVEFELPAVKSPEKTPPTEYQSANSRRHAERNSVQHPTGHDSFPCRTFFLVASALRCDVSAAALRPLLSERRGRGAAENDVAPQSGYDEERGVRW